MAVFVACPMIVIALVVGCASESTRADVANVTFTSHVHTLPVRDAAASGGVVDYPVAHLVYHGGRVVPAPRVVAVTLGTGQYIPKLVNAITPNMASAYHAMVTEG